MKKKILIVEDEEFLLEMYKVKFEKEGFDVISLGEGDKVHETALKEQPDLVLLDIILPKMNGYEVLKQLRSDEQTKGIKIYILSNLGQSGEVNEGLKKGADGYLVKANLTPSQLAEYVKNVLGSEKEPEKAQKKPRKKRKIVAELLFFKDKGSVMDVFTKRLKQEDYNISIVEMGEPGIEFANKKIFDIIIIDLVSAASDCIELLSRIRNTINKLTPAIVLSNNPEEQNKEELKNLGVLLLLSKLEVDPEVIIKEIKTILIK